MASGAKNWRDFIIVLYFFLVVGLIYFLAYQRHFPVKFVDPDELPNFLRNNPVIVVDVRESSEWVLEPVSMSRVVHCPFSMIIAHHLELSLDPRFRYLFVCNDGNRSRLVASRMAEKGYSVYVLKEGLWGLEKSASPTRLTTRAEPSQ